jgi:hypothetical protein
MVVFKSRKTDIVYEYLVGVIYDGDRKFMHLHTTSNYTTDEVTELRTTGAIPIRSMNTT